MALLTTAGPVEEEVFENERFQPFRGWGHNWPGHFLPTDKVGHWSHRDGTPGKSASMAFSAVAPKLTKASLLLMTTCACTCGRAPATEVCSTIVSETQIVT